VIVVCACVRVSYDCAMTACPVRSVWKGVMMVCACVRVSYDTMTACPVYPYERV